MAKIRNRCYHLILYPDDPKQVEVLDLIENNYNYAYILHDKDTIGQTDDPKKPHWHVILYFENAKYLDSLAEELHLPPNYIKTDELRKGLEYLIHKNHKNKFQYSIDEVYGPLKENLISYLNNSIETEKTSILLLYSLIDTFDGPITLSEFIPLIVQNNLWSFFRRSQLTWFKLIDEHNVKYHVKNVL